MGLLIASGVAVGLWVLAALIVVGPTTLNHLQTGWGPYIHRSAKSRHSRKLV